MYYISESGIILGLDGKIVNTTDDESYREWIRSGEIPEPLVCFDLLFGERGWKLKDGQIIINPDGIAKVFGSN